MMILRKIVSNSIVRSSLYFANQQKRIIKYDEFKLRANTAQSFNELNLLYSEATKQQNYKSQAFAIACRNYSRIFRRAVNVDNFNLNILLGKDYQNLKDIDLKKLNILELIDIVSFLNMGSTKCFLNIQNANFNAFLTQLLQLISQKWKLGQTNRIFSYLSKTARCAQNFHSPQYTYFIKQVQSKVNQIDMFQCLSILNSILRGKNDSQTNQKQIKLLQKIIKLIEQNKWINKCSTHSFIDLINPINQFNKIFPFVSQIKTQLNSTNTSMSQLLQKNYKQLSGEEVIRLSKYIFKSNNDSKVCILLIKSILNCIKQDGTTTIDPIFITRFLCYIKSSIFTQIYPQWQQKMLKMIKYYFIENKMANKFVIEGLAQLADSGVMKLSSSQKLVQFLLQSLQGTAQYNKNQTLVFRYLMLYQLMIKLGMYEQSVHAFNKINQLYVQLNEKSYYFAIFSLFNKHFLKQFNLNKQIKSQLSATQNKTKGFFKKAKQNKSDPTNVNSAMILQELKNIYNIGDMQKSCNKMYVTHIEYLKMSIQSLAYNGQYKNVLSILSNIDFNESQMQIIFSSLAVLSIPPQFHANVIQFMQKITKSKQTCGYLYFRVMRIGKNVDMRCSQNQAILFLSIISKLKNQNKLSYYADNQIINFLMTFLPKQFIKQVTQLIQTMKCSPKQYQYLYLKILQSLIQKSANLDLIKKFVDKMLKIQFTSQQIFNYFTSTLIQNGFAQKQKLIQLGKKLKFKYISEESKQIKYMHQLTSIFKQNQFSTSISVKLRQFVNTLQQIINKKSTKPQKLMKNLTRVLIHIHKHKIMLTNADIKNIFMPIFSKLLNEINNSYWFLKALICANQINWHFPEIHEKLMRIATAEYEWKYEISSQQLYNLLSVYSPKKWDDQFLNIQLQIIRLSPQLTKKVNQQLNSKLQSNSDFANKSKIYIEFLTQTLNQDSKSNVKQI